MDFNNFVFPIPNASYSKNDFKDHIIFIPKKDYSYKDKLKYNINLSNKLANNNKSKISVNQNGKLVSHHKSSSMVQKIPSVTFTIDNKFDEGKNKKLLEKNLEYIPCLFYAPENKSDIILLYFHSNYEDIGNSSSLLKLICKFLNINVLSIEYPNYGIYTSKNSANAETILSDADSIFKFINEVQNINENNIILMGRCIGSGPATYLAKKYNVMSLILLSPLKSIKEAIKTMFPRLKIGEVIQNLVKERFNNMENISEVTSPILFIHGKKDTLIPPSHSIDLINKCKVIEGENPLIKWKCELTHIFIGGVEDNQSFKDDYLDQYGYYIREKSQHIKEVFKPVIFESIYNSIYCPKRFLSYFKENYFYNSITNSYMCKLIDNGQSAYFTCTKSEVNSLKRLNFVLSEITDLSFPARLLFECSDKSDTCTFLVRYSSRFDYWVFGLPILKNYGIIFDYNMKDIEFYSQSNKYLVNFRKTSTHDTSIFMHMKEQQLEKMRKITPKKALYDSMAEDESDENLDEEGSGLSPETLFIDIYDCFLLICSLFCLFYVPILLAKSKLKIGDGEYLILFILPPNINIHFSIWYFNFIFYKCISY